ncbi:MAG: neutral/alkaline non-lysosomal ceramidase N-terminal domain-containing protein [Chthoniobacterales bacterium]
MASEKTLIKEESPQRNEQAPTTYSVGIATGDITPPVGVPLAGYSRGGFHSATGVYHPLRAVAVAIDDGKTPVLILSAEWLGFYNLTDRIRKKISEATEIPETHIILSATHTHCGPAFREDHLKRHGETDDAYLSDVMDTITATSLRAWKYRQPAKLSFGTANCTFAINRRLPDPNNPGQIQRVMAPNPDGFVDHEVPILVIESNDAPRGVLFGYACHPTSRGGLLFGGDYVGFAYDEIQKTFLDVQPCFLQGCAGDIKPLPAIPNIAGFPARSIQEVKELGQELGQAVVRTIQARKLQTISGPISMQQQFIDLQTEPLDKESVTEILATPDAPAYKKRWAEYYKDRMDKGLPEEREVSFEIQTLCFGSSLALVGFSAEMTVEHALRLKRDLSPYFAHVFPIAYTNAIIGYVPVERQFTELGYEVLDANQIFLRTGRFIPETEDQIHSSVHSMLGLQKVTK